MTKLSDSQLVILSHAAKRRDGAVLPLPDSLKIKGGAVTSTIKGLIRKQLIAESPAKRRAAHWRETEDRRRLALEITPEGLEAIGVTPAKAKARRRAGNSEQKAPARSPRRGTKQAHLVELLARPEGATIPQLQAATGWLPHTARAALTGLRKRGFAVTREKQDTGPSVYRVAVER